MKVIACIAVLVLISLSVIAITAGQFPRQPSAVGTEAVASSRSSQRLIASGTCQSRLWGKLLTGDPSTLRGIQVVLDGDGQEFKAAPDAGGLYGVAGLCAGDYAIHLQAGDRVITLPQRFEMNGHDEVRRDIAVP